MTIGRRGFLKVIGATAAMAGGKASAVAAPAADGATDVEFNGMLVDTTLCVGCRACEVACNQANGLPEPKVSFESEAVFDERRDTTTDAFTVLNRFPNEKKPDEPAFVRRQCFHCNQPGCATACLVKALEKTKEGAVVYNAERCMGCRYCMIACPFDIPKYQYDSPAPFVRKCTFCAKRQKQGLQPACAEECPTGATLFGKKRELLEIARARIQAEPEKYVHHIYGEHEVGGTGWLYLAGQQPEKLGLPTNLGTTPYSELTSGFLYAVPLVFVLWPSILFGLNHMTRQKSDDDEGGAHGDHE